MKVAQLCPTLCDPTDYTVRGILQATILEWVGSFPFSFLQGIIPTQGLNSGLPHCRWIFYQLSPFTVKSVDLLLIAVFIVVYSKCVLLLFSHLCPTSVTTWTVALQALLSMRFPRQEYWRGLPFSSPFMCASKSLYFLFF